MNFKEENLLLSALKCLNVYQTINSKHLNNCLGYDELITEIVDVSSWMSPTPFCNIGRSAMI